MRNAFTKLRYFSASKLHLDFFQKFEGQSSNMRGATNLLFKALEVLWESFLNPKYELRDSSHVGDMVPQSQQKNRFEKALFKTFFENNFFSNM